MIEVFIIFAMEMCAGSAHYDQCVEWMLGCQYQQITEVSRWTPDKGAENCVENLPRWATEGM